MVQHVFSKPAVEQMPRRCIGQNEIEAVLQKPDGVALQGNIKIYQTLREENGKYYRLRVFVTENKAPNSIIAACNASKIREPLKTPKSRLATEVKAEFTKVNEHFAERA